MNGRSLRFALLGALASTALLAAACGGGDDDGGDSDGGSTPGGDQHLASGVAGIPDGSPWVDQDNLKFIPSKLTSKVGETIYFKNSETALHTVTIDGKNESGFMKKDAVFQWTPQKAGDYKITCDLHPQMKSTITVTES